MISEQRRPLVVAALVIVIVAATLGCFLLIRNATKGDLDGQVIHPKPWSPPGGMAAKVHGAPGAGH